MRQRVRLDRKSVQPPEPTGRTVLNWNGDADLDISDGVALLSHLFLGAAPHALSALEDPKGCASIPGCPAAGGCP